MKIMIVDDSKILRKRIIGLISDIPGIEISGEASGSIEAIKLLSDQEPDVMVLDIRMPDGSGIEVLKYMHAKTTSAIIIVLTNYPLKQYRDKCMELGADYFFDKSTEFKKACDTIS